MSSIKPIFAFLALIFLSAPSFVFGQSSVRNSHTREGAVAIGTISNTMTGRSYYGIDVGLTGTSYFGNSNFLWHDNTALGNIESYEQYENLGSGLGYLFGVKLGVPIASNLDLQGKVRYVTNRTSRTETHAINLIYPGGGTYVSTATNSFTLNISNIGIAALLDYQFNDKLYGVGGIGYSYILSNNFTGGQNLDPNGISYPDLITRKASGVYSLSIANADISDYLVSSRVDLQLGIGSATRIGTGSSVIDAELLLSVPLTSWLTSVKKAHLDSTAAFYTQNAVSYPNLFYASFTLGIRFPYGSNTEEDAAMHHEASSEAAVVIAKPDHSSLGAEGKVPISGRVTSAKTGKPIEASMTVVDLMTNEVVANDKASGEGYYNVHVKAPGKYSVTADADGYLFGSTYFEVDSAGRILTSHPDIQLSEATTGKTRLLVFFDFNKADLKSQSVPELNRAVRLMKAISSMQVEIAGYTDNVGAPEYNKELSLRRATSVKDYLVDHGISPDRVTVSGNGESSPIADNTNEDGRAQNRRVEFIVVSK